MVKDQVDDPALLDLDGVGAVGVPGKCPWVVGAADGSSLPREDRLAAACIM